MSLVATEHASKTKISATFTLQGMIIYNSRRKLRSMQTRWTNGPQVPKQSGVIMVVPLWHRLNLYGMS